PATFILAGNGTHDFAGTLGLIVSSNATLTGNGSLAVQLRVQGGGRLVPGASVGKMCLSTPPFLSGTVLMEISKNGTVLTNDQIQVTGTLTYGGSLVVSHLGPAALTAGNNFKLFSATMYAGAFTSLHLPPLAPGLTWTNKLLMDGSIEVFAPPAIPMSSGNYTQSFDSLEMSGTANLWRDNSTLLGWYAAKAVSPTTITHYRASDGNDSTGALHSFGSSGSPERALGPIVSDSVGTISYGLSFTNDTATSMSNFVISCTGEQWRNGGSGGGTLTFWYRVTPTPLTNPEPGVVTNWTQVTSLNFDSPTVLIGEGSGLNGNLAANRQVFSTVLIPGLLVPPGQNVFFRWHDINDAGSDQGLAVDDLTVAFSVSAPRFTSIVATNGIAHLTGLGESNVTYAIQAASNLNVPVFWEPIGSNTANNTGLFQFTDTNAPAFPRRFYRVGFP
ncbi:MAG: hypothetical protein ACREUU_04800, partial [Gammaproteobacteria bacterium]